MDELRTPFPLSAHEFKPTALTKDKARGLGLAYVDARWYQHRLDKADSEWQDSIEFTEVVGRVLAVCHLTVNGVTRSDAGECSLDDRNPVTSAVAQAFKRACAKFGLGRYLYFVTGTWADYDSQKKRFTEAGLQQLRTALKETVERANN